MGQEFFCLCLSWQCGKTVIGLHVTQCALYVVPKLASVCLEVCVCAMFLDIHVFIRVSLSLSLCMCVHMGAFSCVIEAERGWKARSHRASNKAHPSNPCDLSDILSAPLERSHYVDSAVVSVICLYSICILYHSCWPRAHALFFFFWLVYSTSSEIFMC